MTEPNSTFDGGLLDPRYQEKHLIIGRRDIDAPVGSYQKAAPYTVRLLSRRNVSEKN